MDAAIHQGTVDPWPAWCREDGGSDGDDSRAGGQRMQEVPGVVPGRKPAPLCLCQVRGPRDFVYDDDDDDRCWWLEGM